MIIKKKKNNYFINNFIGFKNTYIFLKNKKYYSLNFYSNFFNGNTVYLKNHHLDILNNFSLKKKTLKFKNLANLLSKYFFFGFFLFFENKIKFKGKGFKLKKTVEKKYKFFFGHSHFIIFFNNNLIMKKYNKQKHLIICTKKKKLKKILIFFLKIKPISWYTKRGLKVNKQLVQKRDGKKSTY